MAKRRKSNKRATGAGRRGTFAAGGSGWRFSLANAGVEDWEADGYPPLQAMSWAPVAVAAVGSPS